MPSGCSIGWLVPAVPTEEGNTFWGYTSVPYQGVYWWDNLPLLKTYAGKFESQRTTFITKEGDPKNLKEAWNIIYTLKEEINSLKKQRLEYIAHDGEDTNE